MHAFHRNPNCYKNPCSHSRMLPGHSYDSGSGQFPQYGNLVGDYIVQLVPGFSLVWEDTYNREEVFRQVEEIVKHEENSLHRHHSN